MGTYEKLSLIAYSLMNGHNTLQVSRLLRPTDAYRLTESVYNRIDKHESPCLNPKKGASITRICTAC